MFQCLCLFSFHIVIFKLLWDDWILHSHQTFCLRIYMYLFFFISNWFLDDRQYKQSLLTKRFSTFDAKPWREWREWRSMYPYTRQNEYLPILLKHWLICALRRQTNINLLFPTFSIFHVAWPHFHLVDMKNKIKQETYIASRTYFSYSNFTEKKKQRWHCCRHQFSNAHRCRLECRIRKRYRHIYCIDFVGRRRPEHVIWLIYKIAYDGGFI